MNVNKPIIIISGDNLLQNTPNTVPTSKGDRHMHVRSKFMLLLPVSGFLFLITTKKLPSEPPNTITYAVYTDLVES